MFNRKQSIHLARAAKAINHKKDDFEIVKYGYTYNHDPENTYWFCIQARDKQNNFISFDKDNLLLKDGTKLVISQDYAGNKLINELKELSQKLDLFITKIDKRTLTFSVTNFDAFKTKQLKKDVNHASRNYASVISLAYIITDYIYNSINNKTSLSRTQIFHYLTPLFNERYQYQALVHKLYNVNQAPVPIGKVDPLVDTALFNYGFNFNQYDYQHQVELTTTSTHQVADYIVKIWQDNCDFMQQLLLDFNYDLIVPLNELINNNQSELFEQYLLDLYQKKLSNQRNLQIEDMLRTNPNI